MTKLSHIFTLYLVSEKISLSENQEQTRKNNHMPLKVEDLEDQERFCKLLEIPYSDILEFVLEHLKKKTVLIVAYWSFCLLIAGAAVFIRISIAGVFPLKSIILHSAIGLFALPLVSIPLHEFIHVIPFLFTGARNIRVGMDLKQYMFYVTAHRHVVNTVQFIAIALFPFVLISLISVILMLHLAPLWKWSISLFFLAHTTMCTGDIAMLNFYVVNSEKKIYTWDDTDKKIAYFYHML